MPITADDQSNYQSEWDRFATPEALFERYQQRVSEKAKRRLSFRTRHRQRGVPIMLSLQRDMLERLDAECDGRTRQETIRQLLDDALLP